MRSELIERLSGGRFDVLVVGGGINGAVSAAALAAGGASVALVDRGDFGGLTSQETSNLVWGGVKYLARGEVRLVWSLCGARNRLVAAFPGRVRPPRVLGVLADRAPVGRRAVVAGAALYWALGRGVTPRPRSLSPRRAAEVEPLVDVPGLRGAVEYSDARLVDGDARFVWDFVAAALDRGAVAVNYVEVTAAERVAGPRPTGRPGAGWRVELRDVRTGERLEATARVVVNAAGPLAPDVGALLGAAGRHRLALSKGVHLVVPRLVAHDRVVAMYDDDSRPLFVIPHGDRTMIGTTDTRVDDAGVEVTDDDRAFLLGQVNRRLALERPLTAADVVAERAGVRPRVLPERSSVGAAGRSSGDGDWLALSRRHRVDVDLHRSVVTVLGGKLTDCVNVGDEVLDAMSMFGLEVGSATLWYGSPAIPDARERRRLARELAPAHGDHGGAAMVEALWRRQGTKAPQVLAAWRRDPSSAAELVPGTRVSRAEVEHIARTELVVTAEDLLRRRTLLGQTRSPAELAAAGAVTDAAGLPDLTGLGGGP